MASVSNPIINLYQMQLEASRRFVDAVFSGTERMDRVMLEATHRAFNEQVNFAQAVAAVRDPSGAANLQTAILSRSPDNATDYQKEIIHIFSDMQNEIGRSMQYYVEHMGTNPAAAAEAAETAQKQASDTVLNPITGMLSVWETAFREVASMANRNMSAARANFENAASAASSLSRANGNAIANGKDLSSTGLHRNRKMRKTVPLKKSRPAGRHKQ